MTDALVQFLRDRLDEDEAVARRACEYAEASWKLDEEFGETILWWPPEPRVAEKEREHGLPVTSDQWRGQTIGSSGQCIAPHMARHDPARVLREVEAKRQILRVLESAEVALRNTEPGKEPHELMTGAANSLRAAVRLLALPYADHEAYSEDWKP